MNIFLRCGRIIQTVLSPKGRLKEGTANKGYTWHAFRRKDGVCDWEESETCVPNISHSYKPALVRDETKGWEGGRMVDNLKVNLKFCRGMMLS